MAIGESLRQQTWSYTYDLADQLKSATSSLGPIYQYGYDAAGNITSIQRPGGATTSITYNSVNQITTANGTAYSYDANGNLLQDYARTYQWDAENRLIAIGYLNQPGVFSTFRYDGLGRRVAIGSSNRTVSGEFRYLWCGMTLCQARTSGDVVTRRYFREGEEDLTESLPLYYAIDQLGSGRDVVAANSGLRSAHFDYDPYGAPIRSGGRGSVDFRFAGLFYHQPSGLYLAVYRAYDPLVGRWLSRDPLEEAGGVDLYSSVKNDPINRTDPYGLLDVYGFGTLTFTTPGPLRGGGEVSGLIGYNTTSQRSYAGVIEVAGGEIGGEQNYVAGFIGAEKTSDCPYPRPIVMSEFAIGPEIPFVAGFGVGLGRYSLGDESGTFIFAQADAGGQAISLGLGVAAHAYSTPTIPALTTYNRVDRVTLKY
jgi:RHS repeat-associated protein